MNDRKIQKLFEKWMQRKEGMPAYEEIFIAGYKMGRKSKKGVGKRIKNWSSLH